MIESPQHLDVKKAPATDSSSDFDGDDDNQDVEYIECDINHAENRIRVTSHRISEADPAWSKVGSTMKKSC
jgi:hypothetical protein